MATHSAEDIDKLPSEEENRVYLQETVSHFSLARLKAEVELARIPHSHNELPEYSRNSLNGGKQKKKLSIKELSKSGMLPSRAMDIVQASTDAAPIARSISSSRFASSLLLRDSKSSIEKTKLLLYPRKSVRTTDITQTVHEDGLLRAMTNTSHRNSASRRSSARSSGIRRKPSKETGHAPQESDSKTPMSILLAKDIDKVKASIHDLSEYVKSKQTDMSDKNEAEYMEYLATSNRCNSNFILFMDSIDYIPEEKVTKIKVIGTFLLGDKIGRGAFGKVKEGICTETLQRIAVKIISKKRVKKSPNGAAGVMREINMLQKLKHKNVVTLINTYAKVEDKEGNVSIFPWFATIEEEPVIWFYEDGTEEEKTVSLTKWYLVFQFCPCSLQRLLDESDDKKLPLSEVHRYFKQLMEGVAYLHSSSVIHRDIKPDNMLITADGILKITDFGVAETFDQYSPGIMKTEIFAGTHQFLSPEVVDGSDNYDGTKVDIWACGVTLYSMMAGHLPFIPIEPGNFVDLYEKIGTQPLEIPAEATPDVHGLLYGLFEKTPSKRWGVEEVLQNKWVKFQYFRSRHLPHILAYREDSNNQPDAMKEVGCETTMIPYLQKMFKADIEKILTTQGSLSDRCPHLEADNDSLNSPKSKKKIMGWISKVLHQ